MIYIHHYYLDNKIYEEVLREGAKKANEESQKVLKKVKQAIGLLTVTE